MLNPFFQRNAPVTSHGERKQGTRELRAVALSALKCLLLELETWPKPGLVSHIDSGSHTDMNASTFRASALAISPYFQAMATAGAHGGDMSWLRTIGMQAESAMLQATAGVNTHRGAIFGLGLLCAAAGARSYGRVDAKMSLGATVATLWGDQILDGPVLLHSHGSRARLKFGAGGARREAALGFPSVYQIGLPALRRAHRIYPRRAEAARVETCFELIAKVEDTNLLHRGGRDGLRHAQRAARQFIEHGGVGSPVWRAHAQAVHRDFVARDLSPGGSADLLAFTLFVDTQEARVS